MEPIMCGVDVKRAVDHYSVAMAYVWGRQDAGEAHRDTGVSSEFADVYSLAHAVTGGYGVGPVQGAYQEWRETGRLLVVVRHRIVEVSRAANCGAAAYPIPWAGNEYSLPYWPGIIRTPASV